ncbi:hypothetical protein [Paraliomyxa miuraensis]|uniref:hypothetical protein n=1 Tax=Paraliomyxa miuraensis TaxID=376150 RepID=UPI0022530245|nr:hypothetical protein [Paraliomyxa miuraensis]MCX4243292.1 hypothetical protein [Paraliomyxa miuraensis]
MHYVCAKCHQEFSAGSEGEGELSCPRCKAQAGLEPVHGVPVAMKVFGMLLAAVVVLALGGGVVGRLMGLILMGLIPMG